MVANTEFLEQKPFNIPTKWLRDGLKRAIETPVEQIMGRIQIPEDIDNDCWLWTGATSSGSIGYGHLLTEDGDDYVHRIMYRHVHGEIPEGQYVLHACDTPTCCNPRHLRVGTAQDNADDRAARGRSRRHLRKAEVELVVRLNRENVSEQEIAALIGVSRYAVRQILAGKRWKSITQDEKIEEHNVV